MSTTHVVSQGDCIVTIAKQYGFLQWKMLWDHPKNAGLKEKRKNPNILLPGDEVFVPDLNIGQYARPTGSKHTFRLKSGPPTKLRVQLVDQEGKAYGDADYTLEVWTTEGGAPVVKKSGKTPGNGVIEATIPEDAIGGLVTLVPKGSKPEEALEWELHLGHLNPSQENNGVQARLSNLGIPVGEPSDTLTDHMKAVLLSFQELHGLPETGELDAATKRKLEDLHDKVT